MVYNLQTGKFYQTEGGQILLAVVSNVSEREDVVTLIGPRTSIEVTDEMADRVKRLLDSEADDIIRTMIDNRDWYEAHMRDPIHLPGDPEVRGKPYRNRRDLV